MPLDLTDDKSTLVQVMAWCHQATSHYLSQCWPRSMSPNGVARPQWVSSLASGICGSNFNSVISMHMLQINFMSVPYETAHRWMPQDTFDDKSSLVQVMAWCHQASRHYVSQCWLRFMLPYGIIRPQWVNTLRLRQNGRHFAAKFSNAFSWMKTYWFWLRFRWSLFQRVQLTIFQHWFR